MIVSREEPKCCSSCGNGELQQDPDVLDTWFSSALWPFSTLGWPEKTEDLHHYFPTSVLVTGYDIITFWVARMIFMSQTFMHDVPFSAVAVHGLVRDAQGRKMSKSLGNGIDPLEIIEKYGADTLRFTLITGQAPGNDQRFRDESVEASRNFSNKIWNASRYVLMNLGGYTPGERPAVLNRHERWILDRYNETVEKTTALLEEYELGEAAKIVYDFLWGDYCDWYIELSKIPLYTGNEEEKERARAVLYHVLEGTLRILHPFMPFISEEIWQSLPRKGDGEALVVAPWPQVEGGLVDHGARKEMDLIREVIRAMRNLRVEIGLSPGQKSAMVLRAPQGLIPLLQEEQGPMGKLTWAEPIGFLESKEEKPSQALTALVGEIEIYLPLEGVVDLKQEIARLEKDLQKVLQDMNKSAAKLANESFLQRAPQEIVEKETNKVEQLGGKRDKLLVRLEELKKL